MKQQDENAISKYWIEIALLGYILIGVVTVLTIALFRSWQSGPTILPVNIALAIPEGAIWPVTLFKAIFG
ncbi:hypothetical protein [Bradyrhizobium sp. URHD0069]|uniref:hypothetical protein n=1 Tax=Bradyrhizobium sp. URHD0069 TaxID=1380355 RepID=UPI0004968117|nr:hypothetical protein [Bradyrhizobium sp. URHD0069]